MWNELPIDFSVSMKSCKFDLIHENFQINGWIDIILYYCSSLNKRNLNRRRNRNPLRLKTNSRGKREEKRINTVE